MANQSQVPGSRTRQAAGRGRWGVPPPQKPRFGLLWIALGVIVLGWIGYFTFGKGQEESRMAVHPPQAPPVTLPASLTPEKAAEARPQQAPPLPPSSAKESPVGRSNLQVVSMSPTSRTFNYRDASIEVEFSHPVKRETVPSAFKVDPAMAGAFSSPTPTRLVFTPQRLWDHGTTYLITLESGISDVYGVDHLDTTSWEFSTVGGYFYTRDVRPLIATYCTPCHRPDGTAGRVPLDTLDDVKRYVQPGAADRSRFITALTDANHQGQLAPQAVVKAYLFRDWIGVFQAAD